MGATSDDIIRDLHARESAIAFVQALVDQSDDGTVVRDQLQRFEWRGEPIKLRDTGRGIRNPRQLLGTLSILTTVDSHYDDTPGPEGLLRYAIRDGEIGKGDNRKLRVAYEHRLPLIWFYGVRPGAFVPLMPVFLVAEEPAARRYVVAIGHEQRLMARELLSAGNSTAREYVERMTRQRLHQPAFRARVMHAYEARCAVCSLAHGALLDAAHIVADGELSGEPVTPNGLALCKIHHAAYDQNILGISPDRVVFINEAVLHEIDGPMLKHGIQDFHQERLRKLPRRPEDQPDPDRLGLRFEEFRKAG
jgi:putative restriction endonuclease